MAYLKDMRVRFASREGDAQYQQSHEVEQSGFEQLG